MFDISTVVFQDGWAYKVKRPVRFEFVDLSTPKVRFGVCQREIELNRRFAPDVYEGSWRSAIAKVPSSTRSRPLRR